MLGKVIGFPVSGPLGAVAWVAQRIAQIVDEQALDPKRIEAALLALERRLEAGEIDEDAFEAEETVLLAELREIRAYRQGAA